MPADSIFYAYAKNFSDDWSWRYVITFVNREVADGWWRAVSSSPASTLYPASVNRVNPQFYTHDPVKANIAYSIINAQVAPQYLGLVFFTLISDRDGRIQSIIPEQYWLDPTSGSTFFIRSSTESSLYWSFPAEGQTDANSDPNIYASRTSRTRFRITLRDQSMPKGTVMIVSDDVYISLASCDKYVETADNGTLVIGANPQVYEFGDLKNLFVAKGPVSANGMDIFTTPGDGEVWELA